MNILLTSTGFLEDRDHRDLVKTWVARHHMVETMPFDRLMGYLKYDTSARWAAVDAIVCKGDTDPEGVLYSTLQRAIKLAQDFRSLPESCAMRDGRKWKSIPFILISDQPYHFGPPEDIMRFNIKMIHPSPYPEEILPQVRDTVDDYLKRVLEDYRDLGLLVTFERGRAQIGPALKKKDPEMESAYYYAPADRRVNKRFMTVMRDNEALHADVELFQQLLDMKVGEREMQRFFEDNPFFLMQARLGVQIPHPSYTTMRWSPDFAFTNILGPRDIKDIELLELKGPDVSLMYRHKQHPGFSIALHKAIDQVRDYGRFIDKPENYQTILKQLGYIPTQSKLAVLIGRDYTDSRKRDMFEQRRAELPGVEVITYDKILETQADQLNRIVIPDFDNSMIPRLGSARVSPFGQ